MKIEAVREILLTVKIIILQSGFQFPGSFCSGWLVVNPSYMPRDAQNVTPLTKGYLILFLILLFVFRKRGKHPCVRLKHWLAASCMPSIKDWASNPGTCPWLGIEPETLRCLAQCSNHSAHCHGYLMIPNESFLQFLLSSIKYIHIHSHFLEPHPPTCSSSHSLFLNFSRLGMFQIVGIEGLLKISS